jgi:hypothetical protein
MFHKLNDANVVLCRGGMYREAALWHRNGVLFAEHGVSLVRLHSEGYTSAKHIMWEEITGVKYLTLHGSTKLMRIAPEIPQQPYALQKVY